MTRSHWPSRSWLPRSGSQAKSWRNSWSSSRPSTSALACLGRVHVSIRGVTKVDIVWRTVVFWVQLADGFGAGVPAGGPEGSLRPRPQRDHDLRVGLLPAAPGVAHRRARGRSGAPSVPTTVTATSWSRAPVRPRASPPRRSRPIPTGGSSCSASCGRADQSLRRPRDRRHEGTGALQPAAQPGAEHGHRRDRRRGPRRLPGVRRGGRADLGDAGPARADRRGLLSDEDHDDRANAPRRSHPAFAHAISRTTCSAGPSSGLSTWSGAPWGWWCCRRCSSAWRRRSG